MSTGQQQLLMQPVQQQVQIFGLPRNQATFNEFYTLGQYDRDGVWDSRAIQEASNKTGLGAQAIRDASATIIANQEIAKDLTQFSNNKEFNLRKKQQKWATKGILNYVKAQDLPDRQILLQRILGQDGYTNLINNIQVLGSLEAKISNRQNAIQPQFGNAIKTDIVNNTQTGYLGIKSGLKSKGKRYADMDPLQRSSYSLVLNYNQFLNAIRQFLYNSNPAAYPDAQLQKAKAIVSKGGPRKQALDAVYSKQKKGKPIYANADDMVQALLTNLNQNIKTDRWKTLADYKLMAFGQNPSFANSKRAIGKTLSITGSFR